MVHESMRNLRLDKRLLRRRGWLSPEEFQKELEALPDVAPKADRVAVLESPGEGERGPESGETA